MGIGPRAGMTGARHANGLGAPRVPHVRLAAAPQARHQYWDLGLEGPKIAMEIVQASVQLLEQLCLPWGPRQGCHRQSTAPRFG